MKKNKRLLVMAGGTGGHVFPAIAVAQYLQQQGWEILWLGTKDRMEATLVPKYGMAINFIEISGIRGKGILNAIVAPLKIINAIFQAKKIINKFRPNIALGMGGYVTGPGGVATKLMGVPLVIHEQNAVVGLTNKLLSKIATVILQAFPNTFKDSNILTVGNPVREAFYLSEDPALRYKQRQDSLRILIVGGSQGANILNITLPRVITNLQQEVEVYHQVGQGSVDKVKKLYSDLHIPDQKIKVVEFIDDISIQYAWADIVICRAGALTVSEISMIGVAAIFIPFQHKDKQQYFNAKFLADHNGAIIIEQIDLSVEKLVAILNGLDREQLSTMAIQAKTQSKPNATKEVADIIAKYSN